MYSPYFQLTSNSLTKVTLKYVHKYVHSPDYQYKTILLGSYSIIHMTTIPLIKNFFPYLYLEKSIVQ